MSLAFYQATVVCLGAVLAIVAALTFSGRVVLPRPAIGTFNGRDVLVLFAFIGTLPVLYLAVPRVALACFLCVTFASAMHIGYRPVVPGAVLWPGIAALLSADIVLAAVSGTSTGSWQAYWAVNSVIVMLTVAAVSNLYIQGGMRLVHVAWFALGLAVYDPVFTFVFPVTDKLADRFDGFALDPSMGFQLGPNTQNIGLGDLLVFTLFVLAAYRGYGRRAALASVAAVIAFGCVAPIALSAVASALSTEGGFVIPVQTFFGPAAFMLYLWFAKRETVPRPGRKAPAPALSTAPAATSLSPSRPAPERPASRAASARARVESTVPARLP
jgi:hypothetical protein